MLHDGNGPPGPRVHVPYTATVVVGEVQSNYQPTTVVVLRYRRGLMDERKLFWYSCKAEKQ